MTQLTRSVHTSPVALFPSDGNTNAYGAHYAMPDGIMRPDGTLIAVARKGTYHNSYDGNLVLKKKLPGGSWSAEATILNTAYDERDPSLGLLANGDLCLTWNRREYDAGGNDKFYAPFMKCPAGSDPAAVAANWTTPVNITGTGLASDWRVGTDILELTPGGRIVVALMGTPTFPPWVEDEVWIGYTDDGGTTWGMLSQVDSGSAHALHSSCEAQLALCSDGSVLAVYRTIASPWETWARRSTDGCATWSSEWRVAVNSINKTGMIRSPDGDHIICFGNGSTLNLAQSWNDGATFGTVLNTGYAANIYTQPFTIAAAGSTPNVGIVYGNETGSQYGPNNYSSVYYLELTRGSDAPAATVVTLTPAVEVDAAQPLTFALRTSGLTLDADAYWHQSGTALTVHAAAGRRREVTGIVTSSTGGPFALHGPDAADFEVSLNGTDWAPSVTVPAGDTPIWLSAQPTATGTISAELGVPA